MGFMCCKEEPAQPIVDPAVRDFSTYVQQYINSLPHSDTITIAFCPNKSIIKSRIFARVIFYPESIGDIGLIFDEYFDHMKVTKISEHTYKFEIAPPIQMEDCL